MAPSTSSTSKPSSAASSMNSAYSASPSSPWSCSAKEPSESMWSFMKSVPRRSSWWSVEPPGLARSVHYSVCLASGETPGVLQVRGELLLDAFGRLVEGLARTASAAVARFEGVAEDDVDTAAQRRQPLHQPPAPLGASQHGHRDDRGAATYGEVREPGAQGGEVALAAGALREDAQHSPGRQHVERPGDRAPVGDRAVHLQLADARQERAERADERLLLDQE